MKRLAILALLLDSVLSSFTGAAETPNVVIILADDCGYGEFQPFAATKARTPALNAMAAEGMKLTSFYASPVCSMSRACLMTGCYNVRVSVPGVLEPTSTIGLNPAEVTIADIAKQQGYATAIVGKWHLGMGNCSPIRNGFDSFYGTPGSNDQYLNIKTAQFAPDCEFREGYTAQTAVLKAVAQKIPLMRGDLIVQYPADQSMLTQKYTAEAVQFITDNQGGPFLLYLATNQAHAPISTSPGFVGTSPAGPRGDVIQEIDWSVGQVIQTLRDLGLDSSTLVLFMSDNGAPLSGLSGPFTGTKGTCLEGGMRVSCLARWPGHIPAGTVCNRITGTIDVLPTVARLLGAEVTAVIDGVDISPILCDPTAPGGREFQLYYAASGIKAIRRGDWKLFLPTGTATNCLLYNLAVASPERIDVAGSYPDLVANLKAEVLARDLEIRTNARPAGKVAN